MKNSNKFIKWDEKFELLTYQTLTNEEYLERLGNLGKLGRGFMGKKADSSGKFFEKFSNFLEKNIIFLVGIFLGSIIILNIFLTLILVIKYL
jgi:hypothetical protein